MNIRKGLTYDDVLLVPQKSFIDHREDISLKTKLTKNIALSLPFLSASMDTVTEAPMALALAREGGLGIIHRFMTIEEEAKNVRTVKRQIGYVINNPATLHPDDPLEKAFCHADTVGRESFIVVNDNNEVVGILSKRDYLYEKDMSKPISRLMTKKKDLIISSKKTSMEKAKQLFLKHKIEKIPLVDRSGKLTGLITAKSIDEFEQYPDSTKDKDGRYMVGASVGVVGDYMERAEAIVNAGVDVIVVDVAHGHNEVAIRAIKELRKKFKSIDIIGGNVATAAGVFDLIKAGADCVKVGIGPGGLCTTRVVTGAGVPQLTAVLECAEEAKKLGGTIIADGGTNYPGDVTKALAAGASALMLAGWFAGTDESPGDIILRNGMKYKIHRGSASFMSTADRKIAADKNIKLNTIVAEGVESLLPYKGGVRDVIYQLSGALRSGMSYCNAISIEALWKNAEFISITTAGFRESKSHNVDEI